MKRLIWLPVAGFLLVAGAAAAAAAGPTLSAVSTLATDSLSGTATSATSAFRSGPADLLDGVLADLVAAGTITQAQSDAIVQALEDKVAAERAAIDQQRELIQGFIEDGVITQAEIDQLPADSPMREMWNSIAQDGELRLDQLPGMGRGFGFGAGHHGPGHGFMFGPDDSVTDPADGATD